jgi:flagellar hook-basal body complex protein FliE
MAQGEQASLQAATGKADLAQVTEAVNNAEVAMQTVVAIRDRVISAYQDIMRMPI